MNPIKDILDSQKDKAVEHSELFLKAHKSILKYFNEKISPISYKEFQDSYFIFYHGENAVCHFKLNNFPEWLFGIWLIYVEDEKNQHLTHINAEIFAQAENFIDKFKPSRSFFKTEINFYRDNTDKKNIIDEEFNFVIKDYQFYSLNFIWNRPYMALFAEIYGVDFNEDFVRPIKAYFLVKKAYLKSYLEENKVKRANKFFRRKILKWANKNSKEIFKEFEVGIKDRGENWSPRFDLEITIPKGFTNESLQEMDESYHQYKNTLQKRFGKSGWYYDNFGGIDWFEFVD